MGWQALVPVGDGQAEWVNVLDVRMVCEGAYAGTIGVSVQLEDADEWRDGGVCGWCGAVGKEHVVQGQVVGWRCGNGRCRVGQENRQAGE